MEFYGNTVAHSLQRQDVRLDAALV